MIIQMFFKFHDFSTHGTFFVIFQVFHDFQSLWEPCIVSVSSGSIRSEVSAINACISSIEDNFRPQVNTIYDKIMLMSYSLHVKIFAGAWNKPTK